MLHISPIFANFVTREKNLNGYTVWLNGELMGLIKYSKNSHLYKYNMYVYI